MYRIAAETFNNTDKISLSAPGYMYDYYSLRGITWPLSRKVRELNGELVDTESVGGELDEAEIDIRLTRDGDHRVTIPSSALNSDSTEQILVHFATPNMVNQDIVFYKLIFPVTGPAKETGQKYFARTGENKHLRVDDLVVRISSHFAFNIFSYEVRAKKYDINTGESINGILTRTRQYFIDSIPFYQGPQGFVSKELEGDVIKAEWEGSLEENEEIDFRIRGAHLPVFGKFNRAVFWTIIWIFVIMVFMSPFLDVFTELVPVPL